MPQIPEARRAKFRAAALKHWKKRRKLLGLKKPTPAEREAKRIYNLTYTEKIRARRAQVQRPAHRPAAKNKTRSSNRTAPRSKFQTAAHLGKKNKAA